MITWMWNEGVLVFGCLYLSDEFGVGYLSAMFFSYHAGPAVELLGEMYLEFLDALVKV